MFCAFNIIHRIIYSLTRYHYPDFGLVFNALFIPFELFIIGYFFYSILGYDLHKRLVLILGGIFLLLCSIETIRNPENYFDSFINGLESIIIITFSLLYFYEQLRYPKTLFIYTHPAFWGVAGLFLFFAGSFFVFIYRQSSWGIQDFIYQYAYIHAISGILRNLLFSIAMIIKPEKTRIPELT